MRIQRWNVIKSKGRKPPSLEGAVAKIERARHHIDCFHRVWEDSLRDHPYELTCEIYAEGREHVYKLNRPPTIDARLPLIVGDAIHNLRTALDHIAHELVRLNNGEPTRRTAYPIKPRQRVSGGIAPEAGRVINEVRGLDNGGMAQWLTILAELDNIDKHRYLHVVAVQPFTGILGAEFLGENESSNIDPRSKFFPVTWDKHDKVIAKVFYIRPKPERDPYFEITPALVFDESRMPKTVRRKAVAFVLSRVWSLIELDTVPLFEPLFS
jgi:hypothetical protein